MLSVRESMKSPPFTTMLAPAPTEPVVETAAMFSFASM